MCLGSLDRGPNLTSWGMRAPTLEFRACGQSRTGSQGTDISRRVPETSRGAVLYTPSDASPCLLFGYSPDQGHHCHIIEAVPKATPKGAHTRRFASSVSGRVERGSGKKPNNEVHRTTREASTARRLLPLQAISIESYYSTFGTRLFDHTTLLQTLPLTITSAPAWSPPPR